jgi:two-component system, OmpR family, alkaline phosphatase synthesis response regulator PhoP
MAKILLIDDDVDFTAATTTLLNSKGHTVITAASGDEGFSKAKKEKPDLLLLDVMMTTEDEGFVFARKFKEDAQTAHLPVILVTGIKRSKGLPFSYEPDPDWLPVRAVLDKPVKPDDLFKALEEALSPR